MNVYATVLPKKCARIGDGNPMRLDDVSVDFS